MEQHTLKLTDASSGMAGVPSSSDGLPVLFKFKTTPTVRQTFPAGSVPAEDVDPMEGSEITKSESFPQASKWELPLAATRRGKSLRFPK